MKKAGEFFTIRREHFSKACRLGDEKGWLGNGIAYLVLAKSTDATQRVSTAGVNAIELHGGLFRSRATEILSVFAEQGIVRPLGGSRGAPTYELLFDEADAETWLPNAIVDGSGKIVSPLKSIRETRKLAVLETFLDVFDNIENQIGGLSLDLLHISIGATKDRWPVPLSDEWNVWAFTEKNTLGSWGGTERQDNVNVLLDAGLLHLTVAVFGDDGPDEPPLFSMCGTANKASNERALFDALYKLRNKAWRIPLTSKYKSPVLRVVVRPFALAETTPALQFQRERSRVAKALLEENLPQAIAAIENHPAAKPLAFYNGREMVKGSLAGRLDAIVNKHMEPPREKGRLATPEEIEALGKTLSWRKKPALKTG